MTPREVIDFVRASGLAGRGGAGFPHRRQVAGCGRRGRHAQDRGLQRRRGRTGLLQGPGRHGL
ncbi:MAG: hypothetical protein R3A10_02290 [Caldilineaceae bacterium]